MQALSERTANFTDSVIRRMTRIANEYGAVNLSQGFPDFEPPAEITDRLAQVAKEGPHQYALTWGAKNSNFVSGWQEKWVLQQCPVPVFSGKM